MQRRRLSLCLLSLWMTTLATIATIANSAESIRVTQAWARATAPGQSVGAGYLTLDNPSRTEDRLIAITSPVAREAQLHSMTMDGGVMRMRPIEDGLRIPAGGRVTLEPGGVHLMFVALNAPLVSGTTFPVILRFAHAGELRTEFRVEPIGK